METPKNPTVKSKPKSLLRFLKRNWLLAVFSIVTGGIIALIALLSPPQTVAPQKPETALQLINISPQPPVFESAWSTDPIKFTFSQPLNSQTIKYIVNPTEDTRLIFKDESPNAFAILSLSGWKENQPYTITISGQLSSEEGQRLEKDINLTLTRKFPTNFIEPEESHEYPENQ